MNGWQQLIAVIAFFIFGIVLFKLFISSTPPSIPSPVDTEETDDRSTD